MTDAGLFVVGQSVEMNILYRFCCGVMEVVAVLSGYTYEEVNSIAFLYLQPAILLLTAAMPLVLMIYKLWHQRTPKRFTIMAATLTWFLPFAFGALKLWQHYDMSLQENCELAYKDLAWLGETTGLGYELVNILLFIVAFLFLFLLNIFIYTLLRNTVLDAPKSRRRKRTKKQ